MVQVQTFSKDCSEHDVGCVISWFHLRMHSSVCFINKAWVGLSEGMDIDAQVCPKKKLVMNAKCV